MKTVQQASRCLRKALLSVWLSTQILLPLHAAPKSVSIVILPFKNITQNASDDWLQESFSENLTMGLGHLDALHLVERSELKRILNEQSFAQSAYVEAETAPKLGRMVGAQYVVLGNFQKMGSQILINVKLVNTETGIIESASLTQIKGEFSDLFYLQEQLAQRLIQKLDLEFSQQSQLELKQGLAGTRSTEAHEYYIKARLFREKLGENNIQKAIGLLNVALSEDPGYGRAAAELSRVYLDRLNGKEVYRSASLQDLNLAEKFARLAIVQAPTEASGYSALAKVLEAQNKKTEALSAAQKALELEKSTESILAYISLKYAMATESSTSKASLIEQELKALGASFDDPQILFTLGGLYFNEIHSNPRADIRKAEFYYRQAHLKNPHSPYFSFTLAAFYLLQGDTAAAKTILVPLMQDNPENIFLLISGADAAHRLLPDLGELDAEKRMEQAYADYTLAYSHLATLYSQQEKTNPDNIILLLTGAQAVQKLLPEESQRWLLQATQLQSQAPDAYIQLAQLYLQNNQDPQATDRWFQKGEALIGDSANASYSAARYLMLRQNFAAAQKYLDKALNSWKTAASAGDVSARVQYDLSLNTLAQLQLHLKKPTAALQVYQEIVQSNLPPLQKGLAYQRMAEIYAQQNQAQQAFEAYQQYLLRFPKHLQNAQAKNIYQGYFAQKSLQAQPDNPGLLNDTGQAFLLKGDYAQALKYLTRAQSLAPENAVIHYNLGLVYLNLRDYELAVKTFKQATVLNPNYTKAYYNLGLAYYELGQSESAKSFWEKALQLDPTFEAARQALQAN